MINCGVLILAILALLWRNETTLQTKSLQCLLLLGSPITLFYSITYLPELLHIAGAVGLYLLLKHYILSTSRRDFLFLFVYILILGSIRSTWFFAFFGLIVLPGPIKGVGKLFYLGLGLVLPFLYQHFLHEQVPNTFSTFGELVEKKGPWAGIDAIFFNVKRNIYFTFTYTEGYFYTLQKLWIVASLLFSILFYRTNKSVQFGIIVLVSLITFNTILYKNYNWVEFRMYAPMTIFLNLEMLSTLKQRLPMLGLLLVNLLSFFLVLPLQQELIYYRIGPSDQSIPEKTLNEIKDLESPLIAIDSLLLNSSSIILELPVLTNKSQLIRYILPYYSMEIESASHLLIEEKGQLRVNPVKIRCQ